MKKTPFKKKKTWKPLKRTSFKGPKTPLKRTKLRIVGQSTTAELKRQIQAILREIVISRDGGCFLRNLRHKITPQYMNCGGYRKDGQLILQAEHLHSRSNASSFSDSRLVVCICQRHHIYYKPQHSAEYNELAKEYIGKERSKLWDRVREDRSSHKVDLKLELIVLEKELTKLKKSSII
jgi:hypothetical protein